MTTVAEPVEAQQSLDPALIRLRFDRFSERVKRILSALQSLLPRLRDAASASKSRIQSPEHFWVSAGNPHLFFGQILSFLLLG